ncbi:hypothetical protein [Pseudoneobacillus sp. C159]
MSLDLMKIKQSKDVKDQLVLEIRLIEGKKALVVTTNTQDVLFEPHEGYADDFFGIRRDLPENEK